MPYRMERDPGWEKLQEELAAALAPFAAKLAARECEHGPWVDCVAKDGQGCDFNDTQPRPGSMAVLTEFVLVANVQDMGVEDEATTVVVSSPNLRNTGTKGLLHVALYE